MPSLSTAVANAVNDHINSKTTYAKPAAVYAGLVTTNSTPDTPGTEASYSGYARVAIPAANFAASAAGAANVTAPITWPTRTDAGAAQTVVGVVFYDAASGGTYLRYGNGLSMPIVQGMQPQFAANALGTSIA